MAVAQKNLDTPNLDFSQGEKGWTYQTGWYTTPLKGEASDYTYFWDRTAKNSTDDLKGLSLISHDGDLELADIQKARFWRFASSDSDQKFSFLPLSVLPSENQGGVMRIGRPEVWEPKGGVSGTYTLMTSIGGTENLDSDGNPFEFRYKVSSMMSGIPFQNSGAESSGVNPSLKRKGDEWSYPYYSEPKATSTPWAAAERMYYDFKVTENSTLLIYRFLAVLSSPESSSHHSANGYPEMVVNIRVKNESTKKWEIVPSNEHHLIASKNEKLNYPGVKPMYADLSFDSDTTVAFETLGLGEGAFKEEYISKVCDDPENHSAHHIGSSDCFLNSATIDYSGDALSSRLHTSGWRTRYADLRKYIGRTIRVEVLNHDCLMNDQVSFAVVAGGHSSYGYFQAETCKMEIASDEKEKNDVIELVAPEGFSASAYAWSRESGGEITQDDARSNVAYVDRASLADGERCFCRINPDPLAGSTATELELNTAFSSIVSSPSDDPMANEDTPNLDFSQGESGWTFQTGWYTTPLDGTPDEGMYIWSQTAKGSTSSLKGIDLSHNGGLTLGASDKSYFWRFSNPKEKDRIFSYLPLYVMPEEGQSGVMRIGRPDVWRPTDGIGAKYTMKSVLGGSNVVDSDGKPYGSLSAHESYGRYLRTFDTGCEASGMSQKRTASEWGHPFCDPNDKISMPWAGAERMYYDFKVTENTSLLIYRFLAVISSPEQCTDHHESGLPGMRVRVLLKNELGKWVEIPCNDYKVTASSHNPLIAYPEETRMFGMLKGTDAVFASPDGVVGEDLDAYIATNCHSPAEHASHTIVSDDCFLNYATADSIDGIGYFSRFHQTGWRTRYADLSAYVGRTVRVEVLNHDCLEKGGSGAKSVVAGRHNSYGYFQAETMRKEIRLPNCVGEYSTKITLEAPKGFPRDAYSWSRQDGKKIAQDSAAPYKAYIERSSVSESELVFCKIDLDKASESSCTQFELSKEIDPVAVRPDAEWTWECDGVVRFADASVVVFGDDEVVSWRWEFPDGSFSTEKDPTFQFEKPKTEYTVRLTVGSTKGCNVMKELKVTTPYFVADDWEMDALYVCEGEDFVLDASSLDEECEYSWFYLFGDTEELLPEVGATLTAHCDGKEGVRYKVKARIGTCEYDRTTALSPLRKPSLNVENSAVVCQNAPLVLSVNEPDAEVKYNWRSADGASTHEGVEWSVDTDRPGEYGYLLKGEQSYDYGEVYTCSDSVELSVAVNAAPVARLTKEGVGCADGPVHFLAEVDEESSTVVTSGYNWYLDGEPADGKSSTCQFSRETLHVGVHTIGLEVWDANGCGSELFEDTFLVSKPLEAYITGDASACLGDSIHYTAHPAGATYMWNDDPSQTASTFSFVAAEDVASVTVSVAKDGCVETVSRDLTVHPLPEVHIDEEKSDSAVFAGMRATLAAVSSEADQITSWNWMPGGMAGSVVSSVVDTTTTFQVTVQDENGCRSVAEYTVVAKTDVPTEITDEKSVCYGEQLQLVAGDPSSEYLWRVRGGKVDSVVATVGNVLAFIPASDCYVYVSPKDLPDGEAEVQVIKVNVLSLPQLSVKGKTELCHGDSLNLVAEGADSYLWTAGVDTVKGAKLSVAAPVAATYSLVGLSEFGCKGVYDVSVVVNPLPLVEIEAPSGVCPGDTVRLKAVSSTCVAYRWGDGSSLEYCDVRAERNIAYTLEGVDAKGCKAQTSVEIEVSDAPTLRVDGDTAVCHGSSAHLWVEGSLSSTWLWSTGETTSEISLENLTTDQTVWVRRTSDGGSSCKAEGLVQVRVYPLPTLSTIERPIVCKGADETALHAQGAVVLEWESNGEPGAELVLGAITSDRVERLRGVDEHGCQSEVEIAIEVKTPPTVRLTGVSETCKGSTAVFRARGADFYEWEDGSTSDTLAVRINDVDTIRLYGRDEYGCQSSVSKIVKVRATPLIALVGDTAVCKGGSVSLVATSTMSSLSTVEWLWSDGNATSKYAVTPEESFEVTLSAVGNRCTTVRNINIIVHPLPELSVEGSTTVCADDTLRLKAVGASTYTWSNGSRSENLEVTVPEAATYTLKGTDAHKCSSTIEVPVVVNPLPTLSLSAPQSSCPGSMVRLLPESDDCVSYLWDDGSALDYRDVEAVEGIAYRVKGFDANGCSAISRVELDVLQEPEIRVVGDRTICQGATASFRASSYDVVDWEWSTGGTGNSIQLDGVKENQSLWVAGTYGMGDSLCVAKQTFDLTVRPLPTLSVKEEPKVCMGGDLTLHAQGADYYRWISSDMDDYELRLENVTEDRLELLSGVDEYGCTDTIEVLVAVRESPIVTMTGPDKACEEDSVVLQGGGASRYEWQDNGSMASEHAFVAYYSNTYTLYGWDEFGCRGEVSKAIEVSPTPEITLAGATTVCRGDMMKIVATATVDSTVWRWSDGSTSPTFTQVADTSLETTVRASFRGCFSEKSIRVNVEETPEVRVEGNTELRHGEQLVLRAEGASSYVWQGPGVRDTGAVFVVSDPATSVYTLAGKNETGCSTTLEISVVVAEALTLQIDGPSAACEGDTVRLVAVSEGCDSYLWSNGEEGEYIDVVVGETATYSVTGIASSGASVTASKEVVAVLHPVVEILGDREFCFGGSTTLEAYGLSVTKWEWSTGDTASSVVVSDVNAPLDGAVWLKGVRVENGVQCASTVGAALEVLSSPYMTVSGERLVCSGEDLMLEANGSLSFYWESDGVEGPTLELKNLTENREVRLVGRNEKGCETYYETIIEVAPLPSLSVDAPLSVCAGEQLSLQADGASKYQWQDDLSDGTQRSVSLDSTSTFILYGWNEYGCKAEVERTIVVAPVPQINIMGNSSVCEGDTVWLKAESDLPSVDWQWSVGATTPAISLRPSADTVVSVVAVTGACSSESIVPVVVNRPPVLSVDGKTRLCEGERLRLTAAGASFYEWIGSEETREGASYSTAEPLSAEYTLVGTDKNGCSSSVKVPVVVYPTSDLSIDVPAAVCEGTSLCLRPKSSACVSYVWNDSISSDSLSARIDANSVFMLKGVDANGCEATASAEVTVMPVPNVSILGDTVLCAGDTLRLQAISDFTAVTWRWNNGFDDALLNALPDTSEMVSVVATLGECSAEASVDIVVKPVPQLAFEGEPRVCVGDYITLTATGAREYYWNGAALNPLKSKVMGQESYRLKGIGENGCQTETIVRVEAVELPKVRIEADTFLCEGALNTLAAVAEGDYTYLWDDDSHSTDSVVTVEAKSTRKYTVAVTDKSELQCAATFSVMVELFEKPTISIDTMVCLGDSLVLTADLPMGAADMQFYWKLGDRIIYDTAMVVPPVTVPTKALLKVHEWGKCVERTEFSVEPVVSPQLKILGDGKPICDAREVTLAAYDMSNVVNHIRYEWYADDSLLSSGYTCKKEYTQSTLLRLKGIVGGCVVVKDSLMGVHPTPEIGYEGKTTLCSRDSLRLSAQKIVGDGELDYYWISPGSRYIISDQLTEPLAVGNYTITLSASDRFGCLSRELAIPVSVKQSPSVEVSSAVGGVVEVCRGLPLKLKAAADKWGLAYAWIEEGGLTDELTIPSVDEEKTYSVSVFDGLCSDTALVLVRPLDAPALSVPDQRLCPNTPATIIPPLNSDVLTYAFRYGDREQKNVREFSITPTPGISTLYIYPTGVNGCVASVPTEVKVDAGKNPFVTIEGSLEICKNSTLKLSPKVSNSPRPLDYYWMDEAGALYSGELNLTMPEAGEFNFTLRLPASDTTGCYSDSSVVVKVLDLPSFEVGGEDKVCLGADAVLEAFGSAVPLSYKWYAENPELNADAPLLSSTHACRLPNVEDTAWVYVVGNDGRCKSVVSHSVETLSKPKLAFTGDAVLCEGSIATLVADGQAQGIMYAWNDQRPSERAIYMSDELVLDQPETVKLTAIKGDCYSDTMVVLSANPLPRLILPEREVMSGEIFNLTYELEVGSADVVSEKWYSRTQLLGGRYPDVAGSPAVVHPWFTSFNTEISTQTSLRLEVETDKGCLRTYSVPVSVREPELKGRFYAFNVLGQLLGDIYLNSDVPVIDQLAHFKSYQVVFLRSYDDEGTMIKVRVSE